MLCDNAPKDDKDASGDTSSDEKVTLHLAALESSYGKDIWEEIAKSYKEANENVEVEL